MSDNHQEQPLPQAQSGQSSENPSQKKKSAPEFPPATPPQYRTVSRNDGADR